MSNHARVTIDRDLDDEDRTFADATTVEVRVVVEFDHGDHDRAALELDKLATEILEQLAALACPCLPEAPAHAHGFGGYAPEPPADTSRLSSVDERHATWTQAVLDGPAQ